MNKKEIEIMRIKSKIKPGTNFITNKELIYKDIVPARTIIIPSGTKGIITKNYFYNSVVEADFQVKIENEIFKRYLNLEDIIISGINNE